MESCLNTIQHWSGCCARLFVTLRAQLAGGSDIGYQQGRKWWVWRQESPEIKRCLLQHVEATNGLRGPLMSTFPMMDAGEGSMMVDVWMLHVHVPSTSMIAEVYGGHVEL